MPNYQQWPTYPQYPTYQTYQQPVMQTAPQQVQQMNSFQNGTGLQQPTPQIQNGGFISVRGEQVARDWPVAPGNSVTFKDETAPFVYIKTMGFNAFEVPQFVKYRLVREEATSEASGAPAVSPDAPPVPVPAWALQSDVDALGGAVELIKNEIEDFRSRLDSVESARKPRGKKEDADHAD